MSDTQDPGEYGGAYLTQTETLDGTWEYDGQEFPLKCEDISVPEQELLQRYIEFAGMAMGMDGEPDEEQIEEMNERAEELDDLPWEENTEHDGLVECTLEAKLIEPNVPVDEMRAPKAQAVFEGMFEAWQEGNR